MERTYLDDVADDVVQFDNAERVLAWLRLEHPGEPCHLVMVDHPARTAGTIRR